MVQQANMYCCELHLSMGDLVQAHLYPYLQITVYAHRQYKLSTNSYGPYTIIECMGHISYKVKLPLTIVFISYFTSLLLSPFVAWTHRHLVNCYRTILTITIWIHHLLLLILGPFVCKVPFANKC